MYWDVWHLYLNWKWELGTRQFLNREWQIFLLSEVFYFFIHSLNNGDIGGSNVCYLTLSLLESIMSLHLDLCLLHGDSWVRRSSISGIRTDPLLILVNRKPLHSVVWTGSTKGDGPLHWNMIWWRLRCNKVTGVDLLLERSSVRLMEWPVRLCLVRCPRSSGNGAIRTLSMSAGCEEARFSSSCQSSTVSDGCSSAWCKETRIRRGLQ